METGLLWCDDSKKKTLEEKVNEAVSAYCTKPCFAGKRPDTCYVHPSMLNEEIRVNGVRVVAIPVIAPHHLLVGVEQSSDGGRDDREETSVGQEIKP
jgi:hypothetical protein